jgi:uncharacterized integral membrane protein
MQLLLILGIICAIGAVAFALQNNEPVTVTLASWQYDSSVAVVLLATLALGALIAGLVSTPSVLKGQWTGTRLRRRIVILEDEKAALQKQILDLQSSMPAASVTTVPIAEDSAPYVGMRAIIAGPG